MVLLLACLKDRSQVTCGTTLAFPDFGYLDQFPLDHFSSYQQSPKQDAISLSLLRPPSGSNGHEAAGLERLELTISKL